MPEPISAVLIGAGQRGSEVYGKYALRYPEKLKIVAVAEPDFERRARFVAQHNIPPNLQFSSWESMLKHRQLAQAAFVCTQDQQHADPAISAMHSGYHVLLEKPMATSVEACRELVNVSREAGRQLHVSHVLRYTQHFKIMREIIQSGSLGQIISVDHRENVSWWHMAHSYVRGNWGNSAQSAPMILTKCCHDFDILSWMLNARCESLSSIGELIHFRPDNAPQDAPARCLDECLISDECPYFAPFIYVDLLPLWRAIDTNATGVLRLLAKAQLRTPVIIQTFSKVVHQLDQISHYRGWPRSVVAHEPTPENLLLALKEGPYGRCVYQCDNNVVDHQIVLMKFTGGISATLTMQGHSHLESRTTRIQGSRGELQAFFGTGSSRINVFEHRSGRRTDYDTSAPLDAGHGGGDFGLVDAFIGSLQRGDSAIALAVVSEALESHLLAFAAEEARLEEKVVFMKEF